MACHFLGNACTDGNPDTDDESAAVEVAGTGNDDGAVGADGCDNGRDETTLMMTVKLMKALEVKMATVMTIVKVMEVVMKVEQVGEHAGG